MLICRLLPVLSLMYFFNSLDRSNLGNAKTDGLENDLHLVGNQYNVILAVFNVTFCLFDLPSNLMLKKFSGKVMLPTMMIGWWVTFLVYLIPLTTAPGVPSHCCNALYSTLPAY